MNLYAVALIFVGLVAIGYFLWGEEQCSRANRHKRQLDEVYDAIEAILEHDARLQRRNTYLEQRRAVITQRWWKRQHHRPLRGWRVRAMTTVN